MVLICHRCLHTIYIYVKPLWVYQDSGEQFINSAMVPYFIGCVRAHGVVYMFPVRLSWTNWSSRSKSDNSSGRHFLSWCFIFYSAEHDKKTESLPDPHQLWSNTVDDPKLTWYLQQVDGNEEKKKERWEWIWNKLRCLWGSEPGSHHLYPSHLVWLKYLTRDKMPGSSQTDCWPQKQHHENSAASATDGLKMVEAGEQNWTVKPGWFFFFFFWFVCFLLQGGKRS